MSLVDIHYTRLPDRTTVFRQHIVADTDECVVTLLEHADVDRPVTVRGTTVLERGAPIVWFTFRGRWHDVGRFHTMDERFTGYYANVLTPVQFLSPVHWQTTDLFLDIWLDEEGAELLDEAELESALRAGLVTVENAARARAEAADVIGAATHGTWPPAVCREWTLERVRAALRTGGTTGGAAV